MKNISKLIIIIIVIGLSAGCKENKNTDQTEVDKVLVGNSQHWGAEFQVQGNLKFKEISGKLNVICDGDYELIVTYKGGFEDIQDMGTISVEAPWGGSSSTYSNAPHKKVFKYQGSFDAGTILSVSQGEEIKITITWDGINGGTEEIVLNQEVSVEKNMNKTDSADIESKTVKYLEDKGLTTISSSGIVDAYILSSDTLIDPKYGIKWGVQNISVDEYIGKSIDTYGFTVKNHKLDMMGDKNETLVWLLVCKDEIIGGYSFPSSSKGFYGAVYSIDGETLEEVTGKDFQTWREEWEVKYKALDEEDKVDNYQLEMDFHPNEGSEIINIIGYGNYESSLQLFDADNNILFVTKRGELFGNIKEVEMLNFNDDNLKDVLVITDLGGTWGAYGYYLYMYSGGAFKSVNTDEFNAPNESNVEVKPNSVSISFQESGDEKIIDFNEDTISTLSDMGIENPSHYDWYPRMLYHYYDNNSELIMVARNQLCVEHKLLVVAEVIVEYGFRNGSWVPIGWDVKDKQLRKSGSYIKP